LRSSSIRLWFCLAVAALGAAIADVIVERASNAGAFGSANFTDHSNLDIVPMLVIGAVFVAGSIALRIRAALGLGSGSKLLDASRAALSDGIVRLLPAIFAMQLVALYAMESAEQFVVSGHTLGGTIWLGGPAWASLAAQAIAGVLVAFALTKFLRSVTRKAVRAIRMIRAMAERSIRGLAPIELDRRTPCVAYARTSVFRPAGERAPPFLTA
jgi:hypothetical protein